MHSLTHSLIDTIHDKTRKSHDKTVTRQDTSAEQDIHKYRVSCLALSHVLLSHVLVVVLVCASLVM